MEINQLKTLQINKLRQIFREYLLGQRLEKATVSTRCTDAFYIWNNKDKESFWVIVESENFDTIAKDELRQLLSKKSKANIDSAVSGYYSHLKAFREFAYNNDLPQLAEEDDIEALKNFILDIDCLDPLAEWTNKFNLFEILKITRTEIRHSNMLAWLLDPKENHGLGDDVIRRFIQYATTSIYNGNDIFDILLRDCNDFTVYRELHSIDILCVSDEEKIVLCIENKIDSKEHDNQLPRYREYVEEQYKDYFKLYIYLSPNGDEPTDSEYWCSMDYENVLNIIEAAKSRVKLIPESEIMISNYIEAIRRDIVGDERLVQICSEIYKKHQKAIDLIIENKPDRAYDLSLIFKKWAVKKTEDDKMDVVLEKCSKTYIRYKTNQMSKLLPDAAEPLSGWSTKNNYFFEIVNNGGNDFNFQLVLSSKNLSKELLDICDRINELYPSKQQKNNWQWRTVFSTKRVKIDEEYTEEKLYKQLDEKFKEIQEFEKELLSKM